MVSLADVRRWNSAGLDGVFRRLSRCEQVIMQGGDDFVAAGKTVRSWQGEASLVAIVVHAKLTGQLDHQVAGPRLIIKAVAEAGDAIPTVQRAIHEAEELARKYGFVVGENGEITDTLTDPGPTDPNPEDRDRARAEVRGMLEQALRTANDIDHDLTDVLTRAGAGTVGTGAETTMAAAAADGAQARALTLPEPPPNATPAQNSGWWDSLSPNAHAILLHDHPDQLGNRDGIPFGVRDKANQARLPGERARLQQELNEQTRAMANTGDADIQSKIKILEAKLDSLDKIGQALQLKDHHLLTLNTAPERVEAAVAVGDVDTARHVAVLTPGFNSTVNGSLASYDSHMTDLRDVGKTIQFNEHDSGGIAAVTWMGYQTPQGSEILDIFGNSVASPVAAFHGGEKLADFLNGIDAARPGDPAHLTALGHSYGSTATGVALRDRTPVNDAVLFGSPGIGTLVPSNLHVDGGHIYDEWAAGDKIPLFAIAHTLGDSPYVHPDYFQRMSTDASTGNVGPLHASHGHSEYLNQQTTSQYNLAAITVGHSELIKR